MDNNTGYGRFNVTELRRPSPVEATSLRFRTTHRFSAAHACQTVQEVADAGWKLQRFAFRSPLAAIPGILARPLHHPPPGQPFWCSRVLNSSASVRIDGHAGGCTSSLHSYFTQKRRIYTCELPLPGDRTIAKLTSFNEVLQAGSNDD